MSEYLSEYLTTMQVAKRLGVSKCTIIRMLETGELQAFRVRKQFRILPASVDHITNNLNNGENKK